MGSVQGNRDRESCARSVTGATLDLCVIAFPGDGRQVMMTSGAPCEGITIGQKIITELIQKLGCQKPQTPFVPGNSP